MALSLGSLPVSVRDRSALRSSDFPPPGPFEPGGDRLSGFGLSPWDCITSGGGRRNRVAAERRSRWSACARRRVGRRGRCAARGRPQHSRGRMGRAGRGPDDAHSRGRLCHVLAFPQPGAAVPRSCLPTAEGGCATFLSSHSRGRLCHVLAFPQPGAAVPRSCLPTAGGGCATFLPSHSRGRLCHVLVFPQPRAAVPRSCLPTAEGGCATFLSSHSRGRLCHVLVFPQPRAAVPRSCLPTGEGAALVRGRRAGLILASRAVYNRRALEPEWRNGRRAGFKNPWAHAHAGSSPASGTTPLLSRAPACRHAS